MAGRSGAAGRLMALAGALVVAAPSLVGTWSPSAAAGAAAPAGSAERPVAGAEETGPPAEIDRLDSILDGLPVAETRATIRATDRFAEAYRAQGEAALRWLAAEHARVDLAAQAAVAAGAVARAEERVRASKAEEDRQAAELRRRAAVTGRRRAELEGEQATLRTLAVAAFASAPADQFAGVGTFDQMSAPTRRDAVRGQVLAKQSGIVDRRERVWRIARGSQAAQRRRHERAVRTREGREVELVGAVTARAELDGRLRTAEAASASRQADLDRAGRARHRALVERRQARLTSRVAGLDLPLVALNAYWRAAERAPCQIPWWVVAGVGRVESGHGSAQGSRLTADGDTTVGILGIPLDGRPGTLPVPDSDGGRLDADPVWDRAVGPMQFIPGTWGRWAADADDDRVADPHNIYDAAAAAARYLCFGRGDLLTEGALRGALLAYNRSIPYGTSVLGHGRVYRDAIDLPEVPPDDPRVAAP